MAWRTSQEHESKGPQKDTLGSSHTDTEKYDEGGQKDKSEGKLKVSGPKHEPSMTDVHKKK